ncbi:MAG: hypothetical protein GY724_25275, partial [Actinomycetia bacterium]|nr:hypothetical protein [Actinomycetes bacterium]
PPSGCRFRTRCPYVTELCEQAEPRMRRVSDDHYVACHHPLVPLDNDEAPMEVTEDPIE